MPPFLRHQCWYSSMIRLSSQVPRPYWLTLYSAGLVFLLKPWGKISLTLSMFFILCWKLCFSEQLLRVTWEAVFLAVILCLAQRKLFFYCYYRSFIDYFSLTQDSKKMLKIQWGNSGDPPGPRPGPLRKAETWRWSRSWSGKGLRENTLGREFPLRRGDSKPEMPTGGPCSGLRSARWRTHEKWG